MKKLIALALCSLPCVAFAFTDVTTQSPYNLAIQSLTEAQILQGYEDGNFYPHKPTNRAEVVKVLMTLFPSDPSLTIKNTELSDVSSDEWYYTYAQHALRRGVVTVYPDNTFKGMLPVNMSEFLRMLYAAADIQVDHHMVEQNPFEDVSKDSWFAKYALDAKMRNLFPVPRTRFYPMKSLTRKELAAMLYRMNYMVKNDLEQYPTIEPL